MIHQMIIILMFNCIFAASNNFISKELKDDFLTYTEIIEDVVENCDDQLDVIFIYESSSTVNNYLQSAKLTKPRIIVSNVTQINTNFTYRKKVDAFFFITNDIVEFLYVMEYLKKSEYWNILSKFYIFYNIKVCHDVDKFIWRHVWHQFKILNSYCVCLQQSDAVIFTYNPYANYAPFSWQITDSSRYNFIIYKQPYIKGQLCHDLNFDRTKYLNKAKVYYLGFFNPSNMPEFTRWAQMRNLKIDEDVFQFPNEDMVATYHPKPLVPFLNHLLNIRLTGLFVSVRASKQKRIEHLNQNKPYLALLSSYVQLKKFTSAFPITYRRYTILSHNQGYWTLFEQIYYLFGIWTIVFTCCFCLLTFFVFWYIAKKDKLMFAFFEIIRLLINSSIETTMNSLSLRVYFSIVFLFFLIIQSVFQGNLANFLTNPIQKPVANTIQDLESPVYSTIIGGDELHRLNLHTNLSHKFKYLYSYSDRMNTIFNNKSVALFGELNNLQTFILSNNTLDLYFAKQPIVYEPSCYLLYEDSPLVHRLNKAILTFWEIGMSHYFMTKGFSITQMFLDKRRVLMEIQRIHQPINLNSLNCVFILLGVGTFIATMCFFIELMIASRKKKIQDQ